MKKISLISLIFVMSIIFSACGTSSLPVISVNSVEQIGEIIVAENENLPEMQELLSSDENFEPYIGNYFSEDYTPISAVVYYPKDSTQASEIAVFECESEDDVLMVKKALEEYKDVRQGTFAGYSPEQEDIIENGTVIAVDNLVVLIICESAQDTTELFVSMAMGYEPEISEPTTKASESVADESSSETPVVAQDEFNSENVINAYKNSDDDSLMPKDKEVYDIVVSVISENISDDMTEYEKELIIHDWIIDNTQYDPGELSTDPNAVLSPEHDNPYGTLVYGYAICTGYTSTFQLFMDMLEIECLSVNGNSHGGTEDHAWNMVKLDGEWYFVDVTWDDPVGGDGVHTYFNVTSEFIANRDHFWEMENFPEATATKHAYKE